MLLLITLSYNKLACFITYCIRVKQINGLWELARRDRQPDRTQRKLNDYIELLGQRERVASRCIKHLDAEIWKLRPLQIEILFVAGWEFCLTASFVKKTQKTPRREIEKAKRELQRFEGLRDEE